MSALRTRVIRRCDRDHYEELHRTSVKYRENNWLLDDLPFLITAGGNSIIEVGCGNGLFLECAAQHWQDVVGVDWVRSAVLRRVLADNPNIRFVEQDIASFDIPDRFDLLVSADVLEHLPPPVLPDVIRRLHACGRRCFHKIACYDDGHSHLTVSSPRRWLRLFEESAPGNAYRIVNVARRNGRRSKPVLVISNMESAVSG